MNPTFNLLWEPWLPCTRADGGVVSLGLVDALERAHLLRAVSSDTPLETAAIHRLLLAFLHRVAGTGSKSAWVTLWQAGRWDAAAIRGYAGQWEDRFDLFDPQHPFYQTHEDRVEAKTIAGLQPGLKSDTLYNHAMDTGDLVLGAGRAARLLVTVQAFGLPGICHPQKGLFFNGAPGVAGWVYLVEGASLFQTLCLNLLSYGPGQPLAGLDRTDSDAPAWEMADPFTPARKAPNGYLDYLTWQNRRVQLIPESAPGGWVVSKAKEAPGLCLEAGLQDPMRHYRQDEKRGWLPARLSADRALWRDSAALLALSVETRHPPVSLRWLAGVARVAGLPPATRLRLMAVGLANDKAKAEVYRLERLPLPLAYLEQPELVDMLAKALATANDVRNKLWGAVRQLAVLMLSHEADQPQGRQPDAKKDVAALMDHWAFERDFWSGLDLPFLDLVTDLPAGVAELTMGTWHQALRRAAWKSLETATAMAGESACALKASVTARAVLGAGLKKLDLLDTPNQKEAR